MQWLSANVTTMRLVSAVVAELIPRADPSASRVSLDWNTVQDLTSRVDKSSNVSFTAPNSSSVLLAYYSRRNGYPEARPGFNGSIRGKPGSWGSWVVDHFSPKGAEVTISFIEQNILARKDIGAMAAQPGVGSYMWEDSMEFWVIPPRVSMQKTNSFLRHSFSGPMLSPKDFLNGTDTK